MKETRYIVDPKQPYGLHDCKITDIRIENNNIELIFKDGFVKLDQSYKKVIGSILVEKADLDFCSIIIQENQVDEDTYLTKQLSIEQFIVEYPDINFEVINEYYGWHRLQLVGCLWQPEGFKEATLSLGYFDGDIIYKTQD